MLELDELHRRFGDVVALDGMTFTVEAGKVVGFLGPNGAGKTTAMRAVLGVTTLDSFSTIFAGSSNGLFEVLAYIPPTAPIASTTLYAIGSIGLGQVAVSAVICVLATVATARLAASVYERSILRTGARVRLREALRAQA
jgi:ABC-type branched-subunit amino acid transport system ATPase component